MESLFENSFGVFFLFEDDDFEGRRIVFVGELNGGGGGRNGWDSY